MCDCWRRARALVCACSLVGTLSVASAAATPSQSEDATAIRDVVAVGIARNGEAIVLATPGLPKSGRSWRFRSLDTRDLPQPIRDVVLSRSGTKLFLQPEGAPGGVLDLTRQYRHNAPLQYVSSTELATGDGAGGHVHRLPAQRFVSTVNGTARVLDDVGRAQAEYGSMPAVQGTIAPDGTVLYLHADGAITICTGDGDGVRACRPSERRVAAARVSIAASALRRDGAHASPTFLAIAGDDGVNSVVDPDSNRSPIHTGSRTEAALRSCLLLHGLSMSDASIAEATAALVRESADLSATQDETVIDWRFFFVTADEELYAPVLEFARRETVFPTSFGMLEQLSEGLRVPRGDVVSEVLYDRYLRLDAAARLEQCSFYFRTHSTPGSWIIEYWLYYPFDLGGLGSHPHDPEHIFVEVDKLGGAPRRVIGAGHGYMAGNNVYTADRRGARAISLPLFAIVELGKHASAPDIDRDGVFTPGVDENEYDERAKIWGVRDVIGTINNQLLAYDSTMSGVRRPDDFLAIAALRDRFPGEAAIAGRCGCRLQPISDAAAPRRRLFRLSDWILLPPCHDLTSACGKLHVTAHPDFIDLRTILKEWAFPSSFLRTTYGLGPRRGMHTLGIGYAIDLDRMPALGRALPLPGRLGLDAFYWHQDIHDPRDLDSCVRKPTDSEGRPLLDEQGHPRCTVSDGAGWGIRYEQFVSNLFGIFSAVRLFTPPAHDMWVTFGPFMESPIGRRSNVLVAGGLSFRPYDSPRFELKVSVGLWKPKTNHIGIHAGTDRSR